MLGVNTPILLSMSYKRESMVCVYTTHTAHTPRAFHFRYCSEVCQHTDWHTHKIMCKEVQHREMVQERHLELQLERQVEQQMSPVVEQQLGPIVEQQMGPMVVQLCCEEVKCTCREEVD